MSSSMSTLYQYGYTRYRAWINRRIKPSRQHKLNNRRLFIFPSRAGFGFLFLVLLLWLLGTNYENNLVLAFAFFMTSMMVVVIHHTFFNMLGMEVEFYRVHPCFLGEQAEVELRFKRNRDKSRESLSVGFERCPPVMLDLIDTDAEVVKLFVPIEHRGLNGLPRLKVQTVFPLGIIRCWTWLAIDAHVLVYPKPLKGHELPSLGTGDADEGENVQTSGSDDFQDLKRYQAGDSLNKIAWKHVARGRGLYTKEYGAYKSHDLWLEWEAMEGLSKEARLSVLCDWVLKLNAESESYGLRIPGIEIAPASGADHKAKLLEILALFESKKPVSRL